MKTQRGMRKPPPLPKPTKENKKYYKKKTVKILYKSRIFVWASPGYAQTFLSLPAPWRLSAPP